jgi:hypothetical protein
MPGAGMYVEYSNMVMTNSSFNNIVGQFGSAVRLKCKFGMVCSVSIEGSTFTNNKASLYGGAIHYNMFKPVTNGNTFEGNEAPYGNNIASYAFKI